MGAVVAAVTAVSAGTDVRKSMVASVAIAMGADVSVGAAGDGSGVDCCAIGSEQAASISADSVERRRYLRIKSGQVPFHRINVRLDIVPYERDVGQGESVEALER